MLISKTKRLLDKYRPLFLGLFLIHSVGNAQTYNPSTCCTVSNKAYGAAQAVSTDGRSWFYDATNFVMRDYNGPTEVYSYLNLAKYRSGHFPIFVHAGGILQGNGVWLGGSTLVYWFKDSTGNANLVRWYTDSTGMPGGPFYAVANNLSEGNAGLIKGNLALDNVDNTSDAQKNAATASLTNHTIDGNDNTLLNIPNSALANNSIGLTIDANPATDISVTATPAALGSSLVVNMPSSGTASRGPLNASDWNFFNGKLDSIRVSNDSVYNCVNGTCTLQSVLAGTGGVNSVDGTNTSLLFSPTTGNVLGRVNPAFPFNWTGQHTYTSFAPVFSTLTTAGGLFYGDGSGQLLQSGVGSSGQILQSNGGTAPTFFTPNAATVNGWLGYTALTAALGSTHIYVGNGSNIATDVTLSGDASLLNTGALMNLGLKGKLLPSLSAGFLQYDGSNWVLNNSVIITTPTFPQVLAAGRTFSVNDSVLLATKEFYWKNGKLKADIFKLDYTDSARSKGSVYLGDSVIMNFYDPNSPGNNIFLGQGAGPRFNAVTPGAGNGSLNISIGNGSFNFCTTCHENTSIGNQNLHRITTGAGNAVGGETAGKEITTANDNTAWGVHALNNDSTGIDNTAIGKRALETCGSCQNNTVVGWEAMDATTTGSQSVAVGHAALHSNTTGGDLVAIGVDALSANTTGNYNVAIGRHSMAYNTNGIENVAVGEEAGSVTNALHDNTQVFLGFQASRDASVGSGTTLNNTIGIGYNAKATCSKCMILGAVSPDTINIGVGNKAPDASAILDLTSTGRGILIPRLSTSQRLTIASPASGLLVYDSVIKAFYFWDGAAWSNVGSGGSGFTFSTGLTNTSGTITNNLSTGVSGGQTIIGGTASGNNLTFSSTSHATKGKDIFGTSAYDEVNNRWGIGTTSPAAALHLNNASTSLAMKISDNSSYTWRFSSDGAASMDISPGGSSHTRIVSQSSDGGAKQSAMDVNVGNGNTVFTSANLGSPADFTDIAGNSRVRLSIVANLQSGVTVTSGNDLILGHQASVGSAVTPHLIMVRTSGDFLLKTLTDSASYLHIGAGDATHAPLKFTAGPLLTTQKNGVIEFDGVHYYGTTGGTRYQLDQQGPGLAYSAVGATQAVNTTSETSIAGVGVGTLAVSANALIVGKTYRFKISGIYNTTTVPGNCTFKLKLGSVVIGTGVVNNLVSLASLLQWECSGTFVCWTTGSSGTVISDALMTYSTGNLLPRNALELDNAGAVSTINTTISNTLDFTVQWATADVSNAWKANCFTLERLN